MHERIPMRHYLYSSPPLGMDIDHLVCSTHTPHTAGTMLPPPAPALREQQVHFIPRPKIGYHDYPPVVSPLVLSLSSNTAMRRHAYRRLPPTLAPSVVRPSAHPSVHNKQNKTIRHKPLLRLAGRVGAVWVAWGGIFQLPHQPATVTQPLPRPLLMTVTDRLCTPPNANPTPKRE